MKHIDSLSNKTPWITIDQNKERRHIKTRQSKQSNQHLSILEGKKFVFWARIEKQFSKSDELPFSQPVAVQIVDFGQFIGPKKNLLLWMCLEAERSQCFHEKVLELLATAQMTRTCICVKTYITALSVTSGNEDSTGGNDSLPAPLFWPMLCH